MPCSYPLIAGPAEAGVTFMTHEQRQFMQQRMGTQTSQPVRDLETVPHLVLSTGIRSSANVAYVKGMRVVQDFQVPQIDRDIADVYRNTYRMYTDVQSVIEPGQNYVIVHAPFSKEWRVMPATPEEQASAMLRLKQMSATQVEGGKNCYPSRKLHVQGRGSELTAKQKRAFMMCATGNAEGRVPTAYELETDEDDPAGTLALIAGVFDEELGDEPPTTKPVSIFDFLE